MKYLKVIVLFLTFSFSNIDSFAQSINLNCTSLETIQVQSISVVIYTKTKKILANDATTYDVSITDSNIQFKLKIVDENIKNQYGTYFLHSINRKDGRMIIFSEQSSSPPLYYQCEKNSNKF